MSPTLSRNRDAIALLAFALTGVAAIGVGIARADLGGEPDPRGPVASAPASVGAASPSPSPVGTPTSTPGVAATAEPVVVPEPEPASWRVVDASVEIPARKVVAQVAAVAEEADPLSVVSVHDVDGRPEIVVREVTGRAEAIDAVREAQNDDDVLAVTLDTEVRTLGGSVAATLPGADTLRPEQWALDRLTAEQTWENATGEGAVVAVVDTGVDGTHPDLEGQLTVAGFDYLTTSADGHTDPEGHGTHVAGIVVAAQGNDLGVAGLAPHARVMPVRVLDADGNGYNSDVARGVTYAADNGADIINLSLGGTYADPVLETAVNYALGKGAIVVAAAGNEGDGLNRVNYPAAFDGVIAVGSTRSSDELSSFSNTGAYVDVAAPGSAIMSTIPGGRYAVLSGTSMATPYVAATAALAVDGTDGAVTAAQFKAALTSTAVDLGAAGRDDYFGYGRIDPNAMVCGMVTCAVAPGGATATPTETPTAEPTESPDALPSIEPSPSPTPTAPVPGGGAGGGGGDAAPAPEPTPTPTPSPSPEPEPIEEPRTDPVPEPPTVQDARLSFVTTPGRARVGQRRPVRLRLETVDGQALAGQDVVVLAWREGRIAARRVVTTDDAGVATAYFPISATTRFTARSLASDEAAADVTDNASRWVATPRFRLGHAGSRASVRLVDDRGQRVLVQVRRGTRWVTVRRPQLSEDGRVVVRGLRAGTYRVRVTPVPGLAAVNSRSWRVR